MNIVVVGKSITTINKIKNKNKISVNLLYIYLYIFLIIDGFLFLYFE